MKVLIIGSGGREHALAWKLSQEKVIEKIYAAPGNGGTAKIGTNVSISSEDIPSLLTFARDNKIDLTVVGPEAPLTLGIVDAFNEHGFTIFGPTKGASQIEGSKSFSKNLMKKYGIPTGAFEEFTDLDAAKKYIKKIGAPIVVKADGLAAGKGVIICHTEDEALNAVDLIMARREFGDAGNKIVIEELLIGEEASFLAFSDGKTVLPMATSQDHKPIYDNDRGPNTGGMGAYSPAPVVTRELFDHVMQDIMIPTVRGMEAEGFPYRGVLYAGLMIKDNRVNVLEFNARFGDPEAQPLLMRLKGDLSPILFATIRGDLKNHVLAYDERPAVCVVMASRGYPGSYEKGKEIRGIDDAEKVGGVVVFHAGTRRDGDRVTTSGGRVLGVTAIGDDLKQAIGRAYDAAKIISWDGAQYRTDISAKGLKYGKA